MTPTDVTIPTGTTKISGELYSPSGTASAGLVVIAYGTDGYVNNSNGQWKTMIRGYGEALAGLGFFALVPRYFERTGVADGDVTPDVMFRDCHDWAAALVDSTTFGRTLPRVDTARIGLLGFSLGGYLCLSIRAAAKPRALVEYFAPLADGIGQAGRVPFAQIHHGTKDRTTGTGFENAEAIRAILDKEKTDVKLFPYEDATHGFSGKDKANTDAATLSKSRTLAFFTAKL